MNAETVNQAYLFLIFILNGFLVGIIFDFFRILRKSFSTPNFMTYIEDTLFWIISGLVVMYSIFIFNNGEFRAYIFIGIFLGIITYMLFLSKIIINISVKLISIVKSFTCFCFRIIMFPINLIYKFMNVILIKPIIKLSTNFYKTLAKFKKKFYNTKKKNKKVRNIT